MVVEETLRSFAEVNSATNKLKVLHLKILTFWNEQLLSSDTHFHCKYSSFPSDPESKQFGDPWFSVEQWRVGWTVSEVTENNYLTFLFNSFLHPYAKVYTIMGPLATPTGHDGIMQWCGNNSSCAQHKNKAEVEKSKR